MRTGEFETTIAYSNGSRSSTTVLFDLGFGHQSQRMYLRITYQASTGARTAARMIIGTQGWERLPGMGGVAMTPQQTVREEVESLLPHVATALETPTRGDDRDTLRWHDATLGEDITLVVNPGIGVPLTLKRVARDLEMTTSVTYKRWNTPIDITIPGRAR